MKQLHFKRIISMLIAVAMLMTMVPATFAATADDFVDFPTGWSKEAMEFSVDNDLLKGKSADKIEPAANLTRAEMATIINRAFGAKVTEDISSYIDVKPTDWYYTEMQKAVNMETFHGDGNGRLRPNDAITREEVMAVIARAMVLEQSDYSPLYKYADYNEFAEWAKPYAAALVAGGYVNGLGNGKIHPKVNITREEFAQLMYNIFKTYHTEAGTYNTVTPQNCVMLNQPGITLENVTVYGDLVLGDGVGEGIVNVKNVTIKGRLLARGGNITLTNVTVDGGVVVKNVNGTTHFNNYKSEAVFDGVIEHTYTTYKSYNVSPGSTVGRPSGGGGGGGGSTSTSYYDYTINYYYMNLDDIMNDIVSYDLVETIAEKSIKSGTKVTLEAKPVRDGYTYVFNADPSSVDSDTETVTITSDIAYHIYYDLQVVKVVAPDGSTQTVVVKNEKTVRQAVAETGLGETETTIDGKEYGIKWYVVKDGESKDDNNVDTEGEWTSIIRDGYHLEYELYADVTLDYNDGATENKTLEILVGADGNYTIPAGDLAVAARDGYRFDGWFDADGKEYTGATLITASPLVITAKWTPLYDVYFRTNKGDTAAYSHQIVAEGEMATKPEKDPVKAGYNFIQWVVYDDAGNATAYDFTKPVTGDLEIVAKWEPVGSPTVYYDVTFMSDGSVYTTTRVESGKTVAKPATDPSKAGYTFVGWYTEGGVAYDFSAAVTGNLTLVAKWEPVTSPVVYYDVTFMSDGSVYTTARVESGKTVARPAADPSKAGYTFVGWYTEGGVAYDFATPVTGNLTLVAKWDAVVVPPTVYTVTFMLNSTDVYTTQQVEENKTATKPTDPTLEGYTFAGWYTEAGVAYDFATPVTGNLTLVAKWDAVVVPPTVYTVTFMLNSTDVYTTQQVESGKTATKPTDPTKEGYIFVEWVVYDNAGNSTAYDFSTPVTGDIVIVASWRLIDTTVKYQIKFFVNAKDSVLCEEVGTMTDITEGSTIADSVVEAFYTDNGYPLTDLAIISGLYQEPVNAELWYQDAAGEWVLFTDETAVYNDMEVYAMVKFASLIFNFDIEALELPIDMLNLTVPYSSDRRFMHSLKDSMLYNRNKVANAMNQTEVQSKVYAKIASATGLIDEKGYFTIKHYAYSIPEVISTLDFQGEIKDLVRKLINGSEADIKEFISLSGYDKLSGKTEQQIIAEIAALGGNAELIADYVDRAYYAIMGRDGYDEFIEQYDADQLNYAVNKDTILYVLGAAHGVEKRDFASALELLGNSSISTAVSKLKAQFPALYAELENSYNNANAKFCGDIHAMRDEIKADENYSSTYNLSIIMSLNTAKLVELMYDDINTRLINKLQDKAPYYYNENAALKQFVETDLFEQLVYPYDASVASDTNTGYQLKAFMDYYDAMFNNLVLFDDAMTWYGTTLSDEEYAEFKADFASDLAVKLQALRDIMAGLDNGGTIRGYTIDDIISKVESLKSVAGAAGGYGAQIEDIINKICDILENMGEGRPVVNGYTVDELAKICDKLADAANKLSNEEYDALNEKLANAIDKVIAKIDEIFDELDQNGTILGRPITDLVSKVDVINNFYTKHKDKIDKIIAILADFDANSSQIEVDIERWENVFFGKETDEIFNIDNVFEILMPVIEQYEVAEPVPVDGTVVIDEYTIGSDEISVTANRYFQ